MLKRSCPIFGRSIGVAHEVEKDAEALRSDEMAKRRMELYEDSCVVRPRHIAQGLGCGLDSRESEDGLWERRCMVQGAWNGTDGEGAWDKLGINTAIITLMFMDQDLTSQYYAYLWKS